MRARDRPPQRRRRWSAAMAVLGIALAIPPTFGTAAEPATASDPAQTAAELEALRHKIGELQKHLDRTRTRHKNEQRELEKSERAIARLSRSLRELRRDLDAQKARLSELKRKRHRREQELAGQKEALSSQLRAAFSMGRQGYVKMLLSQQDVAEIGRSLTYYAYFNRARAARIEAVTALLDELSRLETVLSTESDRLDALVEQRQEKNRALLRERGERERVLAKLEASIADQQQQLDQALTDKRQLEELLRGLRDALADIPSSGNGLEPFGELKGRLPWPAGGPLLARFGQPRPVGNLKWQGVLIDAREGDEVRAVHHGRVAFAEWLRGFGLLIIVDHGNGYMSLYGHNQALYKETGDWVETGEVIATVGRSGGQAAPGLYFEIRHAGVPADPMQWCRPQRRG